MKIRKLIRESIHLAINSISDDIQTTTDVESNYHRAEAIKILAEAFKIVSNS